MICLGTVKTIGTDDATTCHIVVIKHRTTGVTTLSHLDGSQVNNCITKMLKSCSEEALGASASKHDSKFDAFMVGGFDDDRRTSIDLSNKTIKALQSQPHSITLQLACITGLNDRIEGGHHKPIIYGVGVDVQTGSLFPASFVNRGPDMELRMARIFTGSDETLSIYDPSSREMRIGPFDYRDFPRGDMWLGAPDHVILENLSTSPYAEPPHFVESTKAAIRYILDHPRPREKVFANQPRCYILDLQTDKWVQRQP